MFSTLTKGTSALADGNCAFIGNLETLFEGNVGALLTEGNT
jgi:hypothetical protein